MLHRLSIPLLSITLLVTVPSFAATNALKEIKGPSIDLNSLYQHDDKIVEDVEKDIIAEALDAVVLTEKTLIFLVQNRRTEATKTLEMAINKLDTVLTKEPSLGLKPVHVSKNVHKLITNISLVESKIKAAKEHLEKGELQETRKLLAPLVSDITVTITSIPLDTYAITLKTITPLLKENQVLEAKQRLHKLLNTLVIKKIVTPLPPLFAQKLLDKAGELVKIRTRSAEENVFLGQLLADARKQLKMSKLLGYGYKKDLEHLSIALAEIEQQAESKEEETNTSATK